MFRQLLLVAAFVPAFVMLPVEAASKWRTGYYANQHSRSDNLAYLPLADIPWKKYTHVVQSAIIPTVARGLPAIDSNSYGITESKANEFVRLAKDNKVKPLISLMVTSDKRREQQAIDMENNTSDANIKLFVDELVGFVNKYQYDGIDIDWEGHVSRDKYDAQFPKLIALLREKLPGKTITIAGEVQYRNVYATVYNDGSGQRVYDKVDQINLMTYDMDGSLYNGQASPKTWFNTAVRRNPAWPFDSASNNRGNNKTQEEDLKYVLEYARIPASKIGIGVPFYGYIKQGPFSSTEGVTLPEQLYSPTSTETKIRTPISYKQLVTPIPSSNGFNQSRTLENTLVPYYWGYGKKAIAEPYKAQYISYNVTDPKQDAFITYTDSEQIAESIKLAYEKDLGGIMTFALGHEYFAEKMGDDKYPLSSTVYRVMADSEGVAPEAPSQLTATPVTRFQINLKWQDNATNETGYVVERHEFSFGAYSELARLGPHINSYVDNTVPNGNGFWYRVRAVNLAGVSGYSNEAVTSTDTMRAEGGIDVLGCSIVSGWARIAYQSQRLTVDILNNGKSLGQVSANVFRADKQDSSNDGYSGFSFTMPPSLRDGKSHIIETRLIHPTDSTHSLNGTQLPGSPKSIVCN